VHAGGGFRRLIPQPESVRVESLFPIANVNRDLLGVFGPSVREFARGLDFAKEYIRNASSFASGEPCDDECIGGVDERGDGERAAGDEYNGHFVTCFLPFFNLCDVAVGAIE